MIPNNQLFFNSGKNPLSTLLGGLLGYWKLDGNSNDSLMLHNGVDTAITYSAANGKIVQGAGMNGTSSYIRTFNYTELHGATQFSASCWINFTSHTFNYMLSKWNYATQGAFTFRSTNTAAFTFFIADSVGDVGNNTITTPIQSLPLGIWHHITIVYNGALVGGTNKARIYLNGALITGNTEAGTIPSALTSANADFMTGLLEGTTSFLDGKTDEIGLWSRALTQAEVTELYNTGAGVQYPF